MKKLTLMVMAILTVTNALGEFYFPSNQQWKYETTYNSNEPTEVESVSFSYAQVVEGVTYYAFQGYLFRSEGNRIYYRPQSGGTEFLLYDFDVQVGDSLTLFEDGYPLYVCDGENAPYAIVTNVQTVELLEGRTARRISYNNRADDIEFVGAVDGFLAPLRLPVSTCGCITTLICVSQNNEPLYESYTKACDVMPTDILPISQQSEQANFTKYLVNGRLLINTNGQTFDALGREHK